MPPAHAVGMHAGAHPAIYLEVWQFELELAASHRRPDSDGSGLDRAVAQALDAEIDLGIDGLEAGEIDFRIAPT